jgi:membrane protease YdiL (CAAX protease family)
VNVARADGGASWPRPVRATVVGLAFAAAWPSILAWLYFVAMAGGAGANAVQQSLYFAGKGVQLVFPIAFVRLVEGRWPQFAPPRWKGIAAGVAFGFAVATAIFALYFGGLRGSHLLASTPNALQAKLNQFGIDGPWMYLGAAVFFAVMNSLQEEYYFRWFVFGRLRTLTPTWAAIVLSGLVFMAHHVIILAVYFPGRFWSAAAPLSLGIAVGGAAWAWLYQRTDALYAPWISHALIDAAIFVVGWDLLQRAA